jgi:hypothetical protein
MKWYDVEGTARAYPKYGAIWPDLHPHVMVEEIYVLVVSTLHPQGSGQNPERGRVFSHPEEICARSERDHRGANQQPPTWKPPRRGRRNRTAHGRRPQGAATTSSAPTKAPWKMGMQHFHERVRCEMGAKTNVIGFETTQKHLKTSF